MIYLFFNFPKNKNICKTEKEKPEKIEQNIECNEKIEIPTWKILLFSISFKFFLSRIAFLLVNSIHGNKKNHYFRIKIKKIEATNKTKEKRRIAGKFNAIVWYQWPFQTTSTFLTFVLISVSISISIKISIRSRFTRIIV